MLQGYTRITFLSLSLLSLCIFFLSTRISIPDLIRKTMGTRRVGRSRLRLVLNTYIFSSETVRQFLRKWDKKNNNWDSPPYKFVSPGESVSWSVSCRYRVWFRHFYRCFRIDFHYGSSSELRLALLCFALHSITSFTHSRMILLMNEFLQRRERIKIVKKKRNFSLNLIKKKY